MPNLPDTPITGCSEFHTVAVDWAPEYIHYYVNGILVNCVNQPNIVTDQTMYLLINFAALRLYSSNWSRYASDVCSCGRSL